MSIGLRVSELEGIRLKNEIVPWGHNFDPIETSLTWHTSLTRVHLPWKFELSDSSRLGCTPAKVFLLRVHAAARGTCHVARGATWQTPSSFRRFGASFGVCYDRIGPAVPELFTKVLGQTDWLTDKQAPAELQKSTLPRGNLHSSEWANAHSSSLRFWTRGHMFRAIKFCFSLVSFLCNFV